ncbi:MAG: DUF4333 domain-containing protein, partial [Actinomycetota bacterium]|nr:DUF4333 domain-containing protein [Actinomycetota bacterium]
MRTLIATLTALTASAVVAVGCSVQDASRAPTVTSADLQNDIAAQLASAGEQPQEVTCRADLVGEVGQTSRCDVVMSPTNSFQPIVTVTAVDGATIDYEMTPALSREQLERAVVRLLDDAGAAAPTSVVCLADLHGQIGAISRCDITTAGLTLPRTAEVTSVDGLMMNFDLVPILTRTELENSLLDDRTAHVGARPDSATCAGHLEGRPGNTVDCTVADASTTATLRLTVTAVDGEAIDYSYAPMG